jgi:hypothetical protein
MPNVIGQARQRSELDGSDVMGWMWCGLDVILDFRLDIGGGGDGCKVK